ncbi:MAG: hypothetical protein HOW73_46015 [Polyangiaceae bacterium]|nr:hypothetical protein [Polyangiaceae bacterium]
MRLSSTKLTALLAVTAQLALSTAGCGSNFDGNVYHGEGFAFRVSPAPQGWRRMEATGAALAYEDGTTGGQVLVNARCDRDGEDVPLRSLTQHLFIRFTDRVTHSEEVLPFDGREAMRTDITAKLDGVDRRFVVWVMKKDRCVYDLLFFSTPDRFDASIGKFDGWVKNFTALPRPVDP